VSGEVDTVYKMGVTLMDLRQYHDAITYFDKVINITNDTKYHKAAWNNTGLRFLRMKNYIGAIMLYVKKIFEKWRQWLAKTKIQNQSIK
jgi:tetratricopeptide (TPR) repeat protein